MSRATIPTRADPWVRWARYLIVLFIAGVLLALSGCPNASADGPRAPYVYVDPLTRCHYLTTVHDTGLTPRMDRDGKQVCK